MDDTCKIYRNGFGNYCRYKSKGKMSIWISVLNLCFSVSCKTEWAVVLVLVSYQVHLALTLVHQDIQTILPPLSPPIPVNKAALSPALWAALALPVAM
jgi:hypothetical protein